MTQVQVFAVQIARIEKAQIARRFLALSAPKKAKTTKALAPHRAIKDIHESWRERKQPYLSFGARR